MSIDRPGRCLETMVDKNWAQRRCPANRASICADAARAQVGCVVALPNGDVVSGSTDKKVKVFADLLPILRMVNRIAWRRSRWNGAGRAIAEFI